MVWVFSHIFIIVAKSTSSIWLRKFWGILWSLRLSRKTFLMSKKVVSKYLTDIKKLLHCKSIYHQMERLKLYNCWHPNSSLDLYIVQSTFRNDHKTVYGIFIFELDRKYTCCYLLLMLLKDLAVTFFSLLSPYSPQNFICNKKWDRSDKFYVRGSSIYRLLYLYCTGISS